MDNIIFQVEGKGYGFAHVSSGKGFKEINRSHFNRMNDLTAESTLLDFNIRIIIRAVRNLDGYYLKDRSLNIEIR